MKRRKVLAMLTTAVMTFTSLAPEGVLLVRAEDDATEAEAEVLPYGLTGMPDSYVLDAEELEMKASLKENEALETLNGMTPGVDYVEGSVICLADDEEEARTIAEAYNAELICYAQGVAELRLPESMSVADALSVAQDESYRLPVVEPNYLVHRVDPDVEDVIVYEESEPENDVEEDGTASVKSAEATWQDWVLGKPATPAMLTNPDLYIKDPTSDYYQWYHETIGTYNAWATTMGSPDVTVAVIDDGVNPDHPDLKGRVTQVKVNNINPAAYSDSHATHVAGIIAASANNGIGGAGVAPKVKILSLNVFGTSDSCETADEIRALNICIERNIKVVNMSLGGAGYSASEDLVMSQLAATGCCVLAAAGNENSGMKHYPAAFRDTISVASVNIAGTRSRFSNYGSWVDIAAPGSVIMSCYNPKGNDRSRSVGNKGEYGLMNGTSMACPVVSGVVALYVSQYGAVGPVRMRKILQGAGTKAGSKQIGKIVNVGKLFSAGGAKAKASQSEDKQSFSIELEEAGEGAYALYTTDGSDPALMDGAIVNGNLYTGSVELVPAGGADSVTVKTLAVTVNGELGEVETYVFETPAVNPQNEAAKNKDDVSGVIIADVYGRVVNGKGQLFNVNVPKTTYDDSALVLNASLPGTWSVSNAKVLQLSATEGTSTTVRALKAGSAKINFKGSDGSKSSVSVKVIVPASSLVVAPEGGTYGGSIALGKSKKLSPVIGSAYGKPSNKKLVWDYSVNDDVALTAALKAAKAVTISSKGKVSINKTKWNSVRKTSDLLYYDILRVTASTTDGTGLSDTISLYVHKCPTLISLADSGLTTIGYKVYNVSSYGGWVNDGDSDWVGNIKCYLAIDTLNFSTTDVEVKSSNPGLVGVKPLGPVVDKSENPLTKDYRYDGGVRRVCFYALQLVAGNTNAPRTGSAKITVKLLDGSNKKFTFTVNIK